VDSARSRVETRLPVVRLTRRLLFDRRDLDRLIEHNKDAG
jgi:hypothetical protein